MSKVETRAGGGGRGKVGLFPQALSSLDLVGIARATKGDLTPAGEKFCGILRQLTGTVRASPVSKVRTDPILILRTLLRSNTFVARFRFRSLWIHSLGSGRRLRRVSDNELRPFVEFIECQDLGIDSVSSK